VGAARQRNLAMEFADQLYLLFCDDDVVFRAPCLERLYQTLSSDESLGGVNALIENQKYRPPGRWGSFIFRLLDERKLDRYAGRVIGPAVNFLPAGGNKAPVSTEWLNTTCVLYRREALPMPPFPPVFRGYSLCEDLTLSLLVGRHWKLANDPCARIVHKSVPGSHKSNPAALARMEVLHRHYVMTEILGRRNIRHYAELLLWEMFNSVAVSARSHRSTRAFFQEVRGKLNAALILAKGGIS
jgi:GT2 family glycosyltransferase